MTAGVRHGAGQIEFWHWAMLRYLANISRGRGGCGGGRWGESSLVRQVGQVGCVAQTALVACVHAGPTCEAVPDLAFGRETRGRCLQVRHAEEVVYFVFSWRRGWGFAMAAARILTCRSVLLRASTCAALRSAFSLRASALATCGVGSGGGIDHAEAD